MFKKLQNFFFLILLFEIMTNNYNRIPFFLEIIKLISRYPINFDYNKYSVKL